jgi:hypothetical protein
MAEAKNQAKSPYDARSVPHAVNPKIKNLGPSGIQDRKSKMVRVHHRDKEDTENFLFSDCYSLGA